MKPPAPGGKLAQVAALRLARAERNEGGTHRRRAKALKKLTAAEREIMRLVELKIMTESNDSKPISAPVQASAPKQETTTMAKKAKKATKKKAKKPARGRSANASTTKARAADARARKGEKAPAKKAAPAAGSAGRKGVPALDVANFIAGAKGGASMAELVERFGIDAHPMRAKIHYLRHVLRWDVPIVDGYYTATPPKQAAA